MSIAPKIIRECAACGAPSPSQLIDLPRLPLTALFTEISGKAGTREYDQRFLFCEQCGHGMLETQLPPAELYGSEYGFRTAASEFGRQGTGVYVSFLERIAGSRLVDATVVDVGCNDLLLLEQIAPRARKLLGVDPIWKGREHEIVHPKISVIGDLLENVDINARLGGSPDLVLCRHTLEHIDDPRVFMRKLLDAAGPETLFVFEFPHLDTLVARNRYDHIFHQHVQYFSKHSFAALLESLGAEIVALDENPHHWDALLVAFKKRDPGNPISSELSPKISFKISSNDIRLGYARFHSHAALVGQLLDEQVGGARVGFGAAQMLPVIAYHLGGLHGIETVYDDDLSKNGLSYANLPVRVARPLDDLRLTDATVLITAPDSARTILKRLNGLQPREIIVPLLVV